MCIRDSHQFVQRFARQHLLQLVERQPDAVIGDPALREIIGADALRPVAGAHLQAPRLGTLVRCLVALRIINAVSYTHLSRQISKPFFEDVRSQPDAGLMPVTTRSFPPRS